ncbi:MAG: DUF3500 domain-containing protein [Verrucomicrobiota bacterium]
MKKLIHCFAILFLLPLIGQAQTKYPSLPSEVLSNYEPKTPDEITPKLMAERAQQFLAGLSEDLRKQAALPFDSDEKSRWTNVPPRGPQGGVRLGDLNEQQLQQACDLLATVLSPQGYLKARGIPLADDRLLRNGQRRPGFGAEDYWLAIFGDPSAEEPWALQFDGHHLAINLSFHGEKMSLSPSFIGTQPRGFELDGETIEPMLTKDEAALALLRSLSEAQQKEAIIGSRRVDLVAGAGEDGRVVKPIGVSAKDFAEKQKATLMVVIELYVGDLPKPQAEKRMAELKKQTDSMTFGWWGPAEDDGDFSYRILGPSLLIEYAGQDLGGDPHEHLHSMYRDPTNEYGKRIIGD